VGRDSVEPGTVAVRSRAGDAFGRAALRRGRLDGAGAAAPDLIRSEKREVRRKGEDARCPIPDAGYRMPEVGCRRSGPTAGRWRRHAGARALPTCVTRAVSEPDGRPVAARDGQVGRFNRSRKRQQAAALHTLGAGEEGVLHRRSGRRGRGFGTELEHRVPFPRGRARAPRTFTAAGTLPDHGRAAGDRRRPVGGRDREVELLLARPNRELPPQTPPRIGPSKLKWTRRCCGTPCPARLKIPTKQPLRFCS